MRICTETDLAASLLRRDVTLTVTTSGRHMCGAAFVVGPRTIDDHLMYYVAGPGTIRLQLGDREVLLPPETFFWLQPGVPHAITLAETERDAKPVLAGRAGPPDPPHTVPTAVSAGAARDIRAAIKGGASGGRALPWVAGLTGAGRRAALRAEHVPHAEVVFFRFFLGVRGVPWRLAVSWVLRPLEPGLGARLEELLPDHLPEGASRPLALRYTLGTLLARVASQADAGRAAAAGLSRQQKETTLKFLRANLGRRFALREAARQVGLNPDYFSRQFRRSFGLAPRAWATRARIQRAAAQLLETDLRVKQVAAALGYDDLYFFSRQFKQVMGKSPRQYRRGQQA
jgi:AraC-like DNA-binding protein